MKLNATFEDLKKAFLRHSGVTIDKSSISYNLLLFYAVESGLKAVYLEDHGSQNTDEVLDRELWRAGGHDLTVWLKELRLPANRIGPCHNFKLKRGEPRQVWGICHAHQAWRYGIEIDADDQEKLVRWLEAVRNLIKETI